MKSDGGSVEGAMETEREKERIHLKCTKPLKAGDHGANGVANEGEKK